MTGATQPALRERSEIEAAVRTAVHSVADPEYPDVSIVDLGLLEELAVDERGKVHVGLIPTFSGCPALAMIAADVEAAVTRVPDVQSCAVSWLPFPVWSTDRVNPAARSKLSSDYTVVLRRKDGSLRCPVCGADTVSEQSQAGPTRCRAVAWCDSCRNIVEVMR